MLDNHAQTLWTAGFPSIKLLFRKLNATLSSAAPVERLFFLGVPHLLAKTEPPEWPEI